MDVHRFDDIMARVSLDDKDYDKSNDLWFGFKAASRDGNLNFKNYVEEQLDSIMLNAEVGQMAKKLVAREG